MIFNISNYPVFIGIRTQIDEAAGLSSINQDSGNYNKRNELSNVKQLRQIVFGDKYQL